MYFYWCFNKDFIIVIIITIIIILPFRFFFFSNKFFIIKLLHGWLIWHAVIGQFQVSK